MKREFICIVCPVSCMLATEVSDGVLQVTGNTCEKGITFAEKEIYDPERILTTTVKLSSGGLLPVRSKTLVKKHEVIALVSKLKPIVVEPPVEIGQVIANGLGENSVDIIATDRAE